VRHALGRGVDWLFERLPVPPPGLRTPPEVAGCVAHPVVLLVQVDTDEGAIRRTLEAIQWLCRAADVRVVLVIDRPDLAAARRSGVPVELLPGRDGWQRRHAEPSWLELVQHRLAIMRRDYAAATVVEAPRDGVGAADAQRLAAILRIDPLVQRQRAWWRRRVAAVMGLLDRPAVR
jgi:hypothetical protein